MCGLSNTEQERVKDALLNVAVSDDLGAGEAQCREQGRWPADVKSVLVHGRLAGGRGGADVLEIGVTRTGRPASLQVAKLMPYAEAVKEWEAYRDLRATLDSSLYVPVVAVSQAVHEKIDDDEIPCSVVVYRHVRAWDHAPGRLESLEDLVADAVASPERLEKCRQTLARVLRSLSTHLYDTVRCEELDLEAENRHLGVDLHLTADKVEGNGPLVRLVDGNPRADEVFPRPSSTEVLRNATSPPGSGRSLRVGDRVEITLEGFAVKGTSVQGEYRSSRVQVNLEGEATQPEQTSRIREGRTIHVQGRLAALRAQEWSAFLKDHFEGPGAFQEDTDGQTLRYEGTVFGHPLAALHPLLVADPGKRMRSPAHGDLNPRNVILSGDTPFLIDFATFTKDAFTLADLSWLEMCVLRDCVAKHLTFPDVILLQRFLGLLTLLRPYWNEQALQAAASSFAKVLSEDQPALGRYLLILWQVRCGIWNVVPDDCRTQWPQHYFEHLVLSACRTFRWPSPGSPERVRVSAAAAGVASEFLAPDDLLRHWSDEDRNTAARVLGQSGNSDAVTERLLENLAATTGHGAPRGKKPKRSPAGTLPEDPHTAGQGGDVRAADDPASDRGFRKVPPQRRGVRTSLAALPAIAVGAVVVTLLWPGTDPPKPPTLPTCTQHPEAIHLAASSDLSGELAQDAKDYKAHKSGSHCFSITVDKQNSGTTMRALAGGWPKGKPRPDIWSPAGTIWLRLARQKATATTRKLFPEQDPQPIVTSPLVIAMPKPMAQDLERSGQSIGWRTLADAARHSTTFWASHKKPGWGEFKLGKTNPDYSTSGLNATLATAVAATGTSTGLTSQDVTSPAATSLMGDTESAVVHYGDTTLAFLQNLRRADDATTSANPDAALHYISAVTVEEQAVVAYNMGYPCGTFSTERGCKKRTTRPHTPLVAIYPSDGILYSDHPFIELTTMSKEKKAVADGFAAYLRTAKVQKKFNPLGFRTWDNRPTDLLKPVNGALSNPPVKRLPPPEPAALGTLLDDVWPKLRKRAHVSILIDTSGSMGQHVTDQDSPSKMELLKQAAPQLFGPRGFADNDQVGLWEFSDTDKNNVPMGPMSGDWGGVPRRKALGVAFANLRPDGRTALYKCVGDAVDQLRAHYDPSAINAVVVLTDGRNDPKDSKGLNTLLASLGDHRKPVRVFTIAYGNGSDELVTADKTVLEDIAEKSDAHPYDAKDHPADIADVLADVISNF